MVIQRSNPGFWDFIILESIYISHPVDRMKRMFSKKGLVESSKEENTHHFVVLYLLLRKLWNFLESGLLPRWRSRTAASGVRKWILLVAVTAVDHEANLQTAHR